MVDEVDKTLSPKKRATKELEDAFVAALDKIKELDHTEEEESDLQTDDTKLEPDLDLKEMETTEIELKEIKKRTEEELTEAEKVEIIKTLTQLRGIGQKTAEKLVEFGITSIEDIAALEVDMIPETLEISTKSLRTAIKNARKHLEKEKVEELQPDLQEETPVSELDHKEFAEALDRTLKVETTTETTKLDWKPEINQFVESTRDDIRFFYDEMAKFHDALTEMRSDFHSLKKEIKQIDEKLSEILIKNVKSDIDTAKTKIVELQKADFSKSESEETTEPKRSKEEKLVPISPKKVEAKSKSIKKRKKVRVKIPFDELVHRLNDVGLIRGTNEPYFTICEILVEQDPQEMNYDALFMICQLPPQMFSQIIFDLSTKKIIDFDAKTDIVSIRT